jgi:methylmalonyl-CoA mutase
VTSSSLKATNHAGWLKLAQRSLKGASSETLRSRTADGLTIEPLYDAAGGGERLAFGRTARPWRIAQRVDHPDPTEASALALADLEGGANELVLVLAGSPTARGYGVRAHSVDALARALADVDLSAARLRIEAAPFDGPLVAIRMTELLGRSSPNLRNRALDFGLAPVSDMARAGGLPLPWTEIAARFADTAKRLMDAGFTSSLALADGRAAHEAGAGEAQELAFVLATGIAYMRALERHGLSLNEARQALSFLLVAEADELLTIAKLRAMRRLWARVEAALSLPARPITLAAETAWRMMTRKDPYSNMLRVTLAAFSASVGGADSISILPFTAAIGLADAFARRVARNLHHVLAEEAHLCRVADPAAGSGALEGLTEELAKAAWRLFQQIEAEGGIVESLNQGKLQAQIKEARLKREREIGHRIAAITGVSEFALLSELPVPVLSPARGPAAQSPNLALTCEPLPSLRLAEPFEQLRDRSDAVLAKSGRRPCAFLANLGGATSFASRRSFAKSFFEGGGIETIENEAPSTMIGIAEAFRRSGARIACLCSTSDVYAQQGADCARALKEAGAARLGAASRPEELADAFGEVPVDFFAFAGCDALSILIRLYENVFEAGG